MVGREGGVDVVEGRESRSRQFNSTVEKIRNEERARRKGEKEGETAKAR